MTSRKPRHFTVLAFATTHDALAAEQALKEHGIEVVPIPTPKTLGGLCGIALRVPVELRREALSVLASMSVDVASETALDDV